MDGIDLPADRRAWVESVTGLPVVAAARHFAGASRDAWNVDVGDPPRPLFLLCDKGDSGGSGRDAAVLAALAGTAVPVPEVVGVEGGAVLLARVPGRSDFPNVDDEAEREPTARHLMELTGALHLLDPAELAVEHLAVPATAAESAAAQLAPLAPSVAALGEGADPLFGFAVGWLGRNAPTEVERFSLVHSDMGPGNFLATGGRVTAIVDWEIAHVGDPMEDLAAIAVRDMATPMGHLPTRLAEYEASSGIRVDLDRVGYHRALVLTRNALMITLGLAHPPPTFDSVEMTMYQTLLMRAAALVLCDNAGIDRPVAEPVDPGGGAGGLLAALRRDVDDIIVPALPEGLAARRASGVGRALAVLDHEAAVGPILDAAELDDVADLLGARPADAATADEELRRCFADGDPAADPDRIAYLARRMHRLAERRRPLMGELIDRLPQPLEDP